MYTYGQREMLVFLIILRYLHRVCSSITVNVPAYILGQGSAFFFFFGLLQGSQAGGSLLH